MAYRIKGKGLSAVKKDLAEYRKRVRAVTKKLSDTKIEIDIGFNIVIGKVNSQEVLSKLQKELLDAIKKAHSYSVKIIRNELEKALDEAMENPVWNWKNELSGTSDTRDIVDTGKLKNSRRIIVDSDNDIHVIYGTEYAAIVHYGGYVNLFGDSSITYYYPARPWVEAVLEGGGPVPQFDYETVYRTAFTDYMSKLKF